MLTGFLQFVGCAPTRKAPFVIGVNYRACDAIEGVIGIERTDDGGEHWRIVKQNREYLSFRDDEERSRVLRELQIGIRNQRLLMNYHDTNSRKS